jgi:hypothetical protein
MTDKTRAITSLLAAFLLGFAVCFLIFEVPEYAKRHRKPPSPEKFESGIVTRFTRELSLTEPQIVVLKEQLCYIRTQHDSLRQYNADTFARFRDHFRIEFSKVLTAEQQQKFIEFNKKEDAKFQHWDKHKQ